MKPNSDPDWLERIDTSSELQVSELLKRIDSFVRCRTWSEGYFSKVAGGDVGIVQRMRETGRVTAKKMAELERFINEAEGKGDAA